ncbi:hypothetical protein MVES_001700 [Malassezia vespertilionis]|uniref:Uracil-DNA glycosylase-like domain-containing protein n=1 Tax=Malassezia vespertilionis TaxID=2020962 RepID=A0A2N1JCZ3_9BASI|nr:hypothetical protein MVES_001700 [Malassezia vespertilionis]
MVRAPKAQTSRVVSRFFAGEASLAVPDYLASNLDVLFCGINPGTRSAAQGRHYAHPSNHFYQCVHAAGITSELLTPEHDVMFPTLAPHALGLTNLAHRPTRRSEQLRTQELECGVPALVHKVRQYKPRVVCFVGKQIGRVFEKVLAKKHCLGDAATLHLPRSVLGFWFDRSSGTKTFPAQDGGG